MKWKAKSTLLQHLNEWFYNFKRPVQPFQRHVEKLSMILINLNRQLIRVTIYEPSNASLFWTHGNIF